jgi:enterochelin esterase-like enzyme
MSDFIAELEQRVRTDPRSVDELIDTRVFPLVDGTSATFLYIGEADEVHLRHWIFGLPSSQPFQRMHRTPLWTLRMEIPEGSRMEYKFEVVRGREHRLVHDPLNPVQATDPFGGNSVLHAADYRLPEWSLPDPETRPGTLEQHALHSSVFGGERPFTLYLPARYRPTRRYPLLVVHDGPDYLRYSSLKVVLDNLIHRLEIPSLIVACIESPDRMREYAADERHGRFLVEELVPALETRWPLVGNPSARALMGASFGAVAALAAAWQHPGFFQQLLLQSGSFAFTDIGHHDRGPIWDPVVEFVNAFRKRPGRPAERVYLSCGTYESLIYYNRSILPVLQSTGMDVRFSEARDGHNWENWRDRLREGLSWLLPGPLWMVYE